MAWQWKRVLKISAWVAVLIIAVVYLQRYGIGPLKEAVDDMGFWAPLGLFLLRGISIILPALPSSVYSLFAGSLLGFKLGYITIILSDLVFCSSAFFIARRWGRGPVSRLVGARAMYKIDGFSKNQLEGNFLQPVLMGRSMKLHSFVILIALTVGTVLGGIVGAVLAVPITAVAWGIVQVWDGPNTPARWARRKSTEPTPS